MTLTVKSLSAVALAGLLTACGNDPTDDVVRTGPQAVHPSPSALAQSGQF